ncbi:MAG: RHS repeat-associated core domain-containing protein [bacterium]|nr:RHS repeat-associated core domain-containing protein [bacterium]
MQARIRHLPYGEVDVQTTVDQKQSATQYAAFTGQEMDDSTGLIYYNARYYDPSIGRFISPDSVIDGDGTAAIHFNRYAYVANNPINYNDPTGHNLVKFQFYNGGTEYAVTQAQLSSYNEYYRIDGRGVTKSANCWGWSSYCELLWSDYQSALAQAEADAQAAEEAAAAAAAAAEAEAEAQAAAEEAARLAELERIRLELIRQGKIDAANAFKANYKTLLHSGTDLSQYSASSETQGTYEGSEGVKPSGDFRDAARTSEFWLAVAVVVAVVIIFFCAPCAAAIGPTFLGTVGGAIGGAVYGWGSGINVKHLSGEELSAYIVENAMIGASIGGLYDGYKAIEGGSTIAYELMKGYVNGGIVAGSALQQNLTSGATAVGKTIGSVGKSSVSSVGGGVSPVKDLIKNLM